MKKNIKTAVGALAVACLLAGTQSQAGITINTDISVLVGTQGTPASGDTAIFIAAKGDGIVDPNDLIFASNPLLAETQWSLDPNDIVLDIDPFTENELLTAAVNYDPSSLTGLNIPLGTPIYLVFYPGLTYTPTLTGPGQGQRFGIYRDNLADEGFGGTYIGFNSPQDGGTYDLFREGLNVTADYQTAVIPEPSTVVLVGLSALAIAGGLRRRK
jgi:hypothetical protein